MKPLRCPGCGHAPHALTCKVLLPWWRRALGGLTTCRCSYWNAEWARPPTPKP